MRSAGNFSPEWGYLAPAPSMLRTVRVVLVATAIGATAGAGVVLSLVDRSAGDGNKVAVAAHAIVTSAQAAPIQESSAANTAAAAAPLAAAAPAISETRAGVTAIVPPSAAQPVQVQAAVPQIQAPQVQASQVQAAPTVSQTDQGMQPAAAAAPVQHAASADASSTADPSAAAAPPAVAALSDTPSTAARTASDVSGDDQAIVGPQPPADLKKTRHHTRSAGGFPDIGRTLRHLFFSSRAGTSYYPNRGAY